MFIIFRVALIFSPIDQQMVDFDLSLVIKTNVPYLLTFKEIYDQPWRR